MGVKTASNCFQNALKIMLSTLFIFLEIKDYDSKSKNMNEME